MSEPGRGLISNSLREGMLDRSPADSVMPKSLGASSDEGARGFRGTASPDCCSVVGSMGTAEVKTASARKAMFVVVTFMFAGENVTKQG